MGSNVDSRQNRKAECISAGSQVLCWGKGGVEEAVTGEKETYVIPQSIKKKKKEQVLGYTES